MKDANDLVFIVARRAYELVDMDMRTLRMCAGYECETPNEAIRDKAKWSRGQLIELILTEEFYAEHPPKFEED